MKFLYGKRKLIRGKRRIILLLIFLAAAIYIISFHLSKYEATNLIDLVKSKYYENHIKAAPFLHYHSSGTGKPGNVNNLHDPNDLHKYISPPPKKSSSTSKLDLALENKESRSKISEVSPKDRIIIFPKSFSGLDGFPNLESYYKSFFDAAIDFKETSNHLIQLTEILDPNAELHYSESFHPHTFKVFQSSPQFSSHSPLENEKVKREYQQNFEHYTSPPVSENEEKDRLKKEKEQLEKEKKEKEKEIEEEKKSHYCKTSLQADLNIEISDNKSLSQSLLPIISKFKQDNSPYYQELEPFWKNEIDKQIKEQTIDRYWYRLAGSSVWLEQYGVHFMISRVLFSPRGVRNSPDISLTYAQVYNDRWEELENVELIVPSNNPDVGNELVINDQIYTNMVFPNFLTVPSYHDHTRRKRRFYGPEDPRLILVKNPKGFEEPLIVFNAYQRKILKAQLIDNKNPNAMNISFGFYRSMFISWPWQFQRGKANVDDLVIDDNNDNLSIYNRIVELRRDKLSRVKSQKNWTPFISYSERLIQNYDNYIYFVYRWSNLEILKCDLANVVSGISKCRFDYRLNNKLSENNAVGPLRGGTQLVNLNQLLHHYSNEFSELNPILNNLPPTREIWVGFARAHLRNCGCGKDMYRPNMVIITKDIINKEYESNGVIKTKVESVYKINQLSSFISFDLPIVGWDVHDPKRLCVNGEPNVLIPNGISDWNLQRITIPATKNHEEFQAIQDILTLSMSIADYTIELVHIKGLLNELFRLDYNNGNDYSNKIFEVEESNGKFTSSVNKKQLSKSGYNNENVDCALRESVEFCTQYGDRHGAPEERARAERERAERERVDREKAERERVDREKAERDRVDREKSEKKISEGKT